MDERSIEQLLAEGIGHHRAQRFGQARATYEKALQRRPQHPDALYLLGSLLRQTGEFDRAAELIRSAIAIDPKVAEFHNNLGNVLLDQSDPVAAAGEFRLAIGLNPKMIEARVNLARALTDQGKPNLAIPELGAALELQPDFVRALHELGRAHRILGQIDQAGEAYERAVRAAPQAPQGYNNLGTIYRNRGQLDRAVEYFRKSISVAGPYPAGHSGLISTMHFDPRFDMAAQHEEQQRWNRQHAIQFSRSIRPHDNVRNPDRRLRIGFVSPDFCQHCQALFTIPLLKNLNHEQLEIFCYANVPAPDDVTAQLRTFADQWRGIFGMSDDQAADLIRHDRIDILVDLTMHMSRNRLLVFARKPAPVQCTWLAYPGSTGLDAIHFRLTDPHLDPPGMFDHFYSERSIRLPDTFWCYDPLSSEPLAPEPPARREGTVTFGCLNNFCKVNASVLDLWARVLHQVPGSRLRLLSDLGRHRQQTIDRFQTLGISPDRIEFVRRLPRADYLRQYHSIDIGLDTFPYNGHTTSLDAMWMGVPTVTLAGNTLVGRAGLSQLTNVGLTDLIALTPDEFVRIASELARDLDRLSRIRSTLRQRMEACSLMDAPRFARNMQNAFREMWRECCQNVQSIHIRDESPG